MSNDDLKFYCGIIIGDIFEVNYFSMDNINNLCIIVYNYFVRFFYFLSSDRLY